MPSNNTDSQFDFSKPISEEDNSPLYIQVIRLIKQQIFSGSLKPGDVLPPESQICRNFNISRTTVRQAFDQLVEENLIIRRRGKGSFVANPKLRRNLNHMYSFTEDMQAMGLVPHSKVLFSGIAAADKDVCGNLLLAGGSRVFKLERIRYANNESILVETTFLPMDLCPGIDKEDFSSTSLYNTLRNNYDLNMHSACETYEVSNLSKETARLLNCAPATPAFHLKRTAYLSNGTPFEYTNSLVRGDKCLFRVELQANRNHIQFARELTL